MNNVAVIGGSGFIGTRLCQEFQDGDVGFRIIDKRVSETFPSNTVIADVRTLDDLLPALGGCDAIINLAAEHRDDVRPLSLYDAVNVEGARNVCQAAEALGILRLVFTSSVAIYGFAPRDTGEDGFVAPFNSYGRTKAEAEMVYREWQDADPDRRSLVIIRPTVVFGERNRGNVYSLLRQIAKRKFVMVGNGQNRKSMAYVGNVVAFIQHMLKLPAGVHLANYVDKPDFDMNTLVSTVVGKLGHGERVGFRIPYSVGYVGGLCADVIARVTKRQLPISAIRVKKFGATTQFASAAANFDFVAPVTLREGLERTVQYEFLQGHAADEPVFYTE